jgi:hypothetical protein
MRFFNFIRNLFSRKEVDFAKKEKRIFNESGNIFGLALIIDKTSRRECLLCETNLDEDIGKGKWHIPLCKKHRMEELKRRLKK